MKRIFLLICAMGLLLSLCSCGKSEPALTAAYELTAAFVDESAVQGVSGGINFFEGGEAELVFGGRSSSAECSFSGDSFVIKINELEGEGSISEEGTVISFPSIALRLEFLRTQQEISPENDGAELKELSGRIYFSSCEGEWEDYDGRSMALSGQLSVREEGEETLSLFSKYYSESLPMIQLALLETENGLESLGGYVMAYESPEYAVRLEESEELKSNVNNTQFLNPEEYIWYTPSPEAAAPDELCRVLTVTGSCRNSSGGFEYKIILEIEQ